MHLPQSSDAGFCFAQPPTVPDIISFNFIVDGRSWPNQRHVPHQNIPELRNFVEAVTAHKFANPSDAGVVRYLVDAPTAPIQGVRLCATGDEICHIFFVNLGTCSHMHRPKLQEYEWDLKLAETLLSEKYGALGGELDEHRQNGKQGRQKYQGTGAAQNVAQALQQK